MDTPPPDRLRKPAAPAAAAPAVTPAPAPAPAVELRASDADRERVADVLREAFAEGRLTADEHAERVDAAYAARTVGELEPLTRDLPATGQSPAPAPRPAGAPPVRSTAEVSTRAVAVFGGSVRKGRWRVGARTRAVAVFGGVQLDLTDAVFESPEVVIEAYAVFGGVEVKVPENVTLRGGGSGVFGGFEVRQQESEEPYAPVVTVRGAAVFGGVEAKPKRGKRLKEWVRRQLDL